MLTIPGVLVRLDWIACLTEYTGTLTVLRKEGLRQNAP
jgi:hypothetical protein